MLFKCKKSSVGLESKVKVGKLYAGEKMSEGIKIVNDEGVVATYPTFMFEEATVQDLIKTYLYDI